MSAQDPPRERTPARGRLRRLDRRAAAGLAAATGAAAFGLAFWLGWATERTETATPRALPLAARPAAVSVQRLSEAAPLPELRPAARTRPRARARTPTAPRPSATPPPQPRRQPRAPKPVTIVGTG